MCVFQRSREPRSHVGLSLLLRLDMPKGSATPRLPVSCQGVNAPHKPQPTRTRPEMLWNNPHRNPLVLQLGPHAAIGSGGNFALAAARALMDVPEMDAMTIGGWGPVAAVGA